MSKKPNFSTSKEKRLIEAKHELESEDKKNGGSGKTIQTTLLIEASLLYAVKELALRRKQAGIKPDTVTGIIKDALQSVVAKEKINT